jgi:Tol biopolymer transport system component
MTAFTRFDPFERRITDAVDEIAAARLPDYLDDVFRQTARTSQRPRWTFPERWISVDTTLPLPGIARRVPLRSALLLALLIAALVAATAFIVGSRTRVPLPFGPAANGAMVYAFDDDLYVRNTIGGTSRLLIGGPGLDAYPLFSPDGRLIAFSTTSDAGVEHLKVANADGTNVRELLSDPVMSAGAAWRPDSRALAVDTTILGVHKLLIVPIDGTPVTEIDLGDLEPINVIWRPPTGDALLFRVEEEPGSMDLYTVNADGSGLREYDLPGQSAFGTEFTLSGATFSPDGKTIAYNSIEVDRATLVSHFRVGLIRPDGSRLTVPGPTDPRVQEGWPAYSPDGQWILVHRWTFTFESETPEGWVAVMPADLSAQARDIGPRIAGGEETGGTKLWSPDGSRVLWRAGNTEEVFSVDPVSGAHETLTWATDLPGWQRLALP